MALRTLVVSLHALALVAAPALAQRPSQTEEGHARHTDDLHRPGMHRDFSDVERFERRFDSSERLEWQKPEHVVSLLEIEPGMTVVDLGAGTGFFAPYLADAVGEQGTVLALDVEPNMVEHLSDRVAAEDLGQVKPRLVEYDDPGLSPGSVDRILIVNTWHHIDDRPLYTGKLLSALRPGGRIFVVDFERHSPLGPPARHRLLAAEVIAEMQAGGLTASQIDEDLPHQYIVVGRP
jgi:cyclopropane fatty-acyl-phospholipid synthase-like methyltransferase